MHVSDEDHCTPSLKFVGLPIPKIWMTFSHGLKRPDDFDLCSFNITRVMGFLPANFKLAVPLGSGTGQTDRLTDNSCKPYGSGEIIDFCKLPHRNFGQIFCCIKCWSLLIRQQTAAHMHR